MPQMIITLIACKKGIQMLDGVVDVFFLGNFCVVPMEEILTVFFSPILLDRSRSKHGVDGEKVESVRRSGLFVACSVFYNGRVRLYALYNMPTHHFTSSIASKTNLLQDSSKPLERTIDYSLSGRHAPAYLSLSRRVTSVR